MLLFMYDGGLTYKSKMLNCLYLLFAFTDLEPDFLFFMAKECQSDRSFFSVYIFVIMSCIKHD